MIRFLIKGIRRDSTRSRIPVIVVALGCMLTVFLSGYIRGVMSDVIELTAKFQTGHLKVMSQAYAENEDQMPNDLALVDVDELLTELRSDYPDHQWVERIKFGGLVDVPDEAGNTKSQGPAMGLALDMFNESSGELKRMNISNSIIRGELPSKPGQILLSDEFAKRLNIELGDDLTFFGSTMNGSMSFMNYTLTGTIKFGSAALDRGSVVMDISDARLLLDMEGAVSEIYGFSDQGAYFNDEEKERARAFNAKYTTSEDEYKPVMYTLGQQNDMESMIQYTENMAAVFVTIFVFAMSLVLWNTGLLGGLRRYHEFGIRLALGESKGAIYRSLIMEAVVIGLIGSIVGTSLGLFGCYMLQKYGIDISEMMPESTMMYPNILRAKITPDLFYIGFIPGLFSMVLGNMLAGVGIYKRQTAQLFKEMEV